MCTLLSDAVVTAIVTTWAIIQKFSSLPNHELGDKIYSQNVMDLS
jgi:hypothetical protein